MSVDALLARLLAGGIMVRWGPEGVSLRAVPAVSGAPATGRLELLAAAREGAAALAAELAGLAEGIGAQELHLATLSEEQRVLWTAATTLEDAQAQLIELTLRWRPGDGAAPVSYTHLQELHLATLSEEQRVLWTAATTLEDAQAQLIELTLRWRPGDGAAPDADAVAALARRHPMLSALFLPGADEPLLCFPRPAPPPGESVLDLRHLDAAVAQTALGQALRAHALRPFALDREPALRVLSVLEPGGGRVVQLVRHHLVSDGWSLALMLRDLAGLVASLRAGRPVALEYQPLAYAEHACRQRLVDAQDPGAADREAAVLINRLQGRRLRTLALPSGAPHPQVLRRALDARSAQALARQQRLPLFAVSCGLFALVLAWQLGRSNLVFVIDVSTRMRTELESCVGTFVNRAPLVIDLPQEGSLAAFLSALHNQVREVSAQGGVPFGRVLRALRADAGETPRPDVVFGMHAEPRHAPYRALGQAELVPLQEVRLHQPLSFYLTVQDELLHLELRHDAACFGEAAARQLAQGFEVALAHCEANGAETAASLTMLRQTVTAATRGRRGFAAAAACVGGAA